MPNMIVAPEPLAVEAGAKVLMKGGNAVDAAVTCAFVQMIVNPHMCGVGGYTLLTIHPAMAQEAVVLDAPALAGSKVTPSMWEDLVISPDPGGWGFFLKGKVNTVGYQSICTPGTVMAMANILDRWGTISWADALAPAAEIAAAGFPVSGYLGLRWKARPEADGGVSLSDYIRSNAEASRIYLKPDGDVYDTGEIVRNPDYAVTLRHLAEHGWQDFYEGELARRMISDLSANGSFVTADDLANYQLREGGEVVGTYRDYKIVSVPAPHGGPTLIEILNILEGYDLASMDHNSADYIYLFSMAMKAAFADRNPTFGDPAFVDVPVDWMTDKSRAQYWRDKIDRDEPIEVTFTPVGPPDTTHVNVVDAAGNCVALTHSLGASSGVITPGMGFMYNNSMINFHPFAGHPNSIAPGKGRTTGMAPAIVYKDDKPVLVIGAPGATKIITSIAQVIVNVLDFGMSPAEAVLAPRFDCQTNDIRVQARIPEYVCAEIRRKHPIERFAAGHGNLALVHAIGIDPATGQLSGGADTGSDGMPLLV